MSSEDNFIIKNTSSVLCSLFKKHDGVTSGAGTVHPSGAPEFIPGFQWGSCYSIFGFLCSVLQIVVCSFVLFLFAIVLSVLFSIYYSDYLFGIFNLFLNQSTSAGIPEKTTKHPQDTDKLLSLKSFRQCIYPHEWDQERFEDTKEVIRRRKSKIPKR